MEEDYKNRDLALVGYLESPDYFPARLSIPAGEIEIVRMSRKSYRESSFLDYRIISYSDDTYILPFEQIPDINTKFPQLGAHYIFHNAFCSSTLLTRYLDNLSGPLVLREPNILYETATLKRFENTPGGPSLQCVSWEDLFCFVRRMISRRYDSALPTIVKPTDGCNFLMGDLVGSRHKNRGLFIYSALDHFLVSVLRERQRHDWVRIRIQELLLDYYNETGSLLLNPASLSIEQSAAIVWLLHTEQYLKLAQQKGSSCFKSLKAKYFATDPESSLVALCHHFCLRYEKNEILHAVKNTRSDIDAKLGHKAFDYSKRQEEYSAVRTAYNHEIERAINWVSGLNPDRDVFADLPNCLID